MRLNFESQTHIGDVKKMKIMKNGFCEMKN